MSLQLDMTTTNCLQLTPVPTQLNLGPDKNAEVLDNFSNLEEVEEVVDKMEKEAERREEVCVEDECDEMGMSELKEEAKKVEREEGYKEEIDDIEAEDDELMGKMFGVK